MNDELARKLIEEIRKLNGIDWIQLIGILFSALIAYLVAKLQVNKSDEQFQKQIEENRKLEKELYFRKNRVESLVNIINSLEELIYKLKCLVIIYENDLSLYTSQQLINVKKYIRQIFNELRELNQKYEFNHNRLIKSSYFNHQREIMIERDLFLSSSEIKKYVDLIVQSFFTSDFDVFIKLLPATYSITYSELSVIRAKLTILKDINNLYFTDDKYADDIIKTIIDGYSIGIQKFEHEIVEWKNLIDKKDYEKIKFKYESFKQYVKNER